MSKPLILYGKDISQKFRDPQNRFIDRFPTKDYHFKRGLFEFHKFPHQDLLIVHNMIDPRSIKVNPTCEAYFSVQEWDSSMSKYQANIAKEETMSRCSEAGVASSCFLQS